MTAPIEVLEARAITGHGHLRAFAKVRLGCVVIHSRIVQQPGQKAWKADGTGSGSFPVVEITSRSVLDQLRDAVLEAWGREPARSPRCEQPAHGQAAWDRSRDHGDEPP